MSTTVDERVVEMRFDNKQFESNVSTSMSTLDKLKQKLNLSGASKGLEDIDAASKKVNMSSLGNAVESVRVKFSALDVIATTALANITNSAVNAGKQLISSLSIDQISAGWEKFSDKTVSVATLVAQGNALEDVNDQLDRLNWFTDETSYNFTEMVSNIAKFTATGQDLETSVTAMEGIATWAALSGQNASTASRAMYQLSQAMGAGVMRLEDYKSIQNASMDTEEFRQKAIDAAIALGTLKDNGDGTYTSLVDGAEDASWSISQFANHLTKGLWFTSDVMMEVFNDYSSAVAAIYDAASDSGKLASEVIDEIHDKADELKTDTMTDSEAIDEAIRSLGYTLDDGSLLFDSFGLKAFEAAQKARTFKDAIDSVKDAVSTGWMNTFELIFGDAEEATELWTDLANTLWDVFASGGERRNTILEYALHFVDAWETITQKLNAATFGKIEAVGDTIKKTTDAISGAIGTLEYYQDIVTKVWIGYYSRRGDDPDRYDLLSAEGYNPKVVQDLVNLGYGYALTMEDVEAACKRYGITLDNNTDITEGNTEATGELLDVFGQLTDEQLKEAGLTEDEISLYRALEKEANRLGMSISDLAKEMSEQDGRTLLIDGFKNLLDTILGVGKAIKSAWADIFDIPTIGESAVTLYSLIKRFNEFTEKIRLTDKETGKLNETGMKLQRTFKGILAVFKVITTILGGAWKIAFKVVSTVLNAFGLDILDVTAAIGDMLVALSDWILKSSPLVKVINKMISAIPSLIKKFKEWFAVFKETPVVQKFTAAINAIGDAFRKLFNGEINIGEFAALLGTSLAKALVSLPKVALQIGKDFIAGFKNGIGDSIKGVIKSIISFCTNFVSNFASALGVHSPSWKAYNVATDFFQGFINGAKSSLSPVIGVLKNIGEWIISVFKSFWNYLQNDSGDIDWSKIFVGAGLTVIILMLKKLTTVFTGCADILDGVGTMLYSTGKVIRSFSKVLNGVSWDLKANALKKMAIGIAVLVAAIWVLCTIDDVGKLWNAVGVIAALGVILIALAFAMNKLSSASISWNKGPQIEGIKSGLLQIGIAILLVAAAVKMLGNLDANKAEQGFTYLAIIAGGMLVFLAAMGGISRYSGSVNGVGKMMKQLAVAMILMVLVCKLAAKLSPEEMAKGTLFATAFAIFVMAITAVAKGSTKDISKVGSMVLKLTIAMMLMVLVCKLAAKLSAAEMLKGALFAAGFVAFVGALVAVTKISSEQKIAKVSGMILSVSVSMLLMVAVCKLAAKLSKEEMLKGAAFAAGFAVFLAVLVKILKVGNEQKIAKVTGTIVAATFAISMMALICALLGYVDDRALAKGVAAVTVLSTMLAIMIKQLKGAQNVKGSMTAMAIAIAIMAAAVVVLSYIDTDKLITSVAAMVILMSMLALVIKSMSKLKKVKTGSIIALAGVMVVMAGILVLMDALNAENSIKNAIALSTLMIAMTAVLKILEKMNVRVKKALKSALALTTLVIPLLAFGLILKGAQYLKTSTKNVVQLAGLTTAMAVVLKILTAKTINPTKALKSALALTTLVIPLLAFGLILKGAQYIDASTETVLQLIGLMSAMVVLLEVFDILPVDLGKAFKSVIALTTLAIPLLALCAILKATEYIDASTETIMQLVGVMYAMAILCEVFTKLPVDIVACVKGALAVVAVLGIFGVVAAAIGGVMKLIPTLEDFINNGLAVLVSIGGSIGRMIGDFIGGIITGIGTGYTNILVEMGYALESFTASLSTASKNAADVDPDAFDNIESLLLTLLEIAGTSALTSIGDVFTSIFSDQTSAEKFVDDAVTLIGGIARVAETCTGITIDQAAFDNVIAAAQSLADLQSSLDPIGGVIDWFVGKSDLGTFGENLVDFFDSMKIALFTLNGLTVDEAALDAVINATERLSEVQKSLEPIEGVITWFKGRDDLGAFGENLVDFFDSMKIALFTLNGLTVDEAALDAVINATERLSTVQQSLEPIGGVISWFKGQDDLATFGENLVDYFASMKVALSTLDGLSVNTEALDSVVSATATLSELQQSLEPMGGVIKWFTGESDLGTFGERVKPFAEGMKAFSEIGTVDTTGLESITTAGTALSNFEQTLPNVGGVVGWFTGETDLEGFGDGVRALSEGMQVLSGCDVVDTTALDSIIAAAKKLTELQDEISNEGGVVDFFTGTDNLGDFGASVKTFMFGVKDGFSAIEGMSYDEAAFTNLNNACIKLAELQDEISNEGGLVDWFVGSDDLGTFGESVETFLRSARNGFSAIDGMSYDEAAFTAIKDACGSLSELQDEISNQGGLVDWFAGTDDLGTFGESVETFLKSTRDGFSAIDGMTIDQGAFDALIEAAESLSELQDSLDSVGGVVDFFVGQNDLGTFGENIKTFAKGMQALFECTGFDQEQVGNIIDAAESLQELEGKLDGSVGGVVSWFTGQEANLGTFGESIKPFADGMLTLSQCEGFDKERVDSIIVAATALQELEGKLDGSVGGVVSWFTGQEANLGTFGESITPFATGMKALSECEGLDEEVIQSLIAAANELLTFEQKLDGSIGGVISWFTGKKADLGSFGESITPFAEGMKALAECEALDITTIQTLTAAADELLIFEQKLDGTIGGVVSWFSGEKETLGTFGENVKPFAEGMQALAECKALDIDTIKTLTAAADELLIFKEKLDSSVGSIVSWFKNKKDTFTVFSEAITPFANGMKALAECEALDITTIQTLTAAATELNTFQQKLDGTIGGVVSWFSGKKETLQSFSAGITPFADGMKALAECKALDIDTIKSLTAAATELKTFQESLETNAGGLFSWFKEKKDTMGDFSSGVEKFSTGMTSFGEAAAEFDSTKTNGIMSAAYQLKNFLTSLGDSLTLDGFDSFITYVDRFGTNMNTYIRRIAGIDYEKTKDAINTARSIKSFITGFNDDFNSDGFDLFQASLTDFAGAMERYITATADVNPDNASNAITAAENIKTFITGFGEDFNRTGFDSFNAGVIKFGNAMSSYIGSVAGMNVESSSAAIGAAKGIRSFIGELGEDFNCNSLDIFATGVDSFARIMCGYIAKTSEISTENCSSFINIARSIKTFILELADLDVSGLATFNESIVKFSDTIIDYVSAVSGIDVEAATTKITELNTLITKIAELNTDGLSNFTKNLDGLSTNGLDNFVNSFSNASSRLKTAGSNMLDGLIEGIKSKLDSANQAINLGIGDIVETVTNKQDSFLKAGDRLVSGLIDGFSSKKDKLIRVATACATEAKTAIRDKYDSFYNAGSYLVTGFCDGISENSYKAAAKAKAMAEAAEKAARDALDINSPSKVFKEIGSGIPEGFAMGISMLGGEVKKSVTDMTSAAITTTRSAMTTVLDALSGDIDAQPTIRPVIDLTDVQSGANAINGLLSGAHTVGVQSNLNAINFAMNRKLQNGANDDVVSAINDLNDSLGNTRGDTYNLGGITYSNGDEIAEAVQTIVRAALVGRRA